MNTVTIYDSMYANTSSISVVQKPIHHLQCNLTLHNDSYELLKAANVFIPKKKPFPGVVCVLDEMPTVNFKSRWDEGVTTTTFGMLDHILDSQLGKYIKMFAGKNFISMPHTNEFSQHIMKDSEIMSINLKFRIYADTYNQRYRFMTSTYETWLKYLYLATSPLIPMTFRNYAHNAAEAANNLVDTGADIWPKLKSMFSDARSVIVFVSIYT